MPEYSSRQELLEKTYVVQHLSPPMAVETKTLEGEHTILIAMKGSQSRSSKQSAVYIEIGKRNTRNNRMIVGNILAKYDALIRMELQSRIREPWSAGTQRYLFLSTRLR